MQKLFRFIANNLVRVIGLFLLSIFVSGVLLPLLFSLESIKNTLNITSVKTLLGLAAIVTLLLISSWSRANNLWQRYKATQKLAKPHFTFIDDIALFTSFTFLLFYLTSATVVPSVSLGIKALLFYSLLAICVWCFSSYYLQISQSKLDSHEDKWSLSDEPIMSYSQDLLQRKSFIQYLHEEISAFSSDDSIVYGMFGQWGEGKTSCINLLTNELKSNKKFIIVKFDPWYFHDTKSILANFYEQIELAINRLFIFPMLKKVFKKYRRVISSGLNAAGLSIDLVFEDETIDELIHKIERYIASTDKRLIIIIDDIDRLEKEEIMQVLKLVRLNANFQNTIFLLGLDPVVTKNILDQSSANYLEKFIQKPINLPAIDQKKLDEVLFLEINNLLSELDVSKARQESFMKDFSYIYQTDLGKILTTLRKVKLYLNGLRATLPSIIDEVNLYDFFVLEAIRVFFHSVYDDIRNRPWFYIPANWSLELNLRSPFDSKDSKKYPAIKDHINNLLEHEEHKIVINKLLQAIFPVEVRNAFVQVVGHDGVSESFRAAKRLTHPESFIKYFQRQVSDFEIADKYVEETIKNWGQVGKNARETKILTKIKEIQKQKKLIEFLEKIMLFKDQISPTLALSIIQVLYKNATTFSDKGTENSWNSEFRKAENLLLILLNDRTKKVKIPLLIKKIIDKCPSLEFAIEITHACKKESGGNYFHIYESIDFDVLKQKAINRIEDELVKSKNNIFNEFPEAWVRILYIWSSDFEGLSAKTKKAADDYLFELLDADVRNFNKFLKKQMGYMDGIDEQPAFDIKKIKKDYDIKRLRAIALKYDNESSNKKELELIKKFLKVSA